MTPQQTHPSGGRKRISRRLTAAALAVGLTGAAVAAGLGPAGAMPASPTNAKSGSAPAADSSPVQTTVVAPQLSSPSGVAVDPDGNLVVADPGAGGGGGAGLILERSGTGVRSLGFSNLYYPESVAADASGNRYVADTYNNRVLKLSSTGVVSTLGFSGLNKPKGLAVDGTGKVYVSDSVNHRVLAITTGGTVSTVGAGLGTPEDLAVASSGSVYVVDTSSGGHQVWKIPSGGVPAVVPFTGLVAPAGIAVDASETVVVADSSGSGTRIVKRTSGGVQTTTEQPSINYATGLALDGAGNLFVADANDHQIAKITPTGSVNWVPFGRITTPGAAGVAVDAAGTTYVTDSTDDLVRAYSPASGLRLLPFTGLSNPQGIAVDGDGSVYVADFDNDRVVKLTSVGVQSVVGFTGLDGPSGLVVDAAKTLYVTDRFHDRVVKRTAGGTQSTVGFTGLGDPTGLARSAAGDLYVVDANAVKELPAAGAQVTIPFAHTPNRWIAVDGNGTVYIGQSADTVTQRTSGGVESTVDLPDLGYPSGLAVDGSGTLYVADSSRIMTKPVGGHPVELGRNSLSAGRPLAIGSAGQVIAADSDNRRLLEIPGGGTTAPIGFPGMGLTSALAAGSDGHIYVGTSAAVFDRAPDGTASTMGFTHSGAQNLAVDSAQTVYLQTLGGVYKLPKGGAESTVSLPSGMGGIEAVAVDDTDALYVIGSLKSVKIAKSGTVTDLGITSGTLTQAFVDRHHNLFISKFDSDQVIERYAGGGTAVLPLVGVRDPRGVALDADDNVYVSSLGGLVKLTGWPSGPPYAPFGSWSALVTRQYQDLTGKPPTASELSAATTPLAAGSKTPGQVDDALRRGTENSTNVDPTARLYRAFLGRAPDAGGLKFWIGHRRDGSYSLTKMADSFADSNEFKTKYGSLSNKAFVTRIYTDVLGRAADSSGVAYWTKKLDTKAKTRGGVMVGFSESNEYKRKQLENTDASVAYILLMGRAPSAGEASTWVTAEKGGTPHATLLDGLLDSAAYAKHITG